MSWLIRTGSGRNNISLGGGGSVASNYLKRTGTSRNSIQWLNISTSGTHKLLERYNTSRNNIRWNNLTFSFVNFSSYPIYDLMVQQYRNVDNYNVISYKNDGWNIEYIDDGLYSDSHYYVRFTIKPISLADTFKSVLENAYSKVKYTKQSGKTLQSNTLSLQEVKIYTNAYKVFYIEDGIDDNTFKNFVYQSGVVDYFTTIQFL